MNEAKECLERALAGDRRALARMLTLLERDRGARTLVAGLPATGGSLVGVTGAPGVGKSTFIDSLAAAMTASGETVAVLAIDPSSAISGGSLLGDRVRMASLGGTDAFVRSVAARDQLGGLSSAAAHQVRLLRAFGFDRVIVETVGAGQSELEVATLVETTVVVLAPGLGDEVQAAKAGILEVGDLFVLNKADLEGAKSALRALRHMLHGWARADGAWEPEVLPVVARQGTGITEVVAAIERHRAFVQARPAAISWKGEYLILQTVRNRMAADLKAGPMAETVRALTEAVGRGEMDVQQATEEILAAYRRTPGGSPPSAG